MVVSKRDRPKYKLHIGDVKMKQEQKLISLAGGKGDTEIRKLIRILKGCL